jgi:serine kinase of HPr protein (carbohydrate metabolism regulator)
MSRYIEREDHIEREDFNRLIELVRRATNLIADDLTDATPESAPEHFSFIKDAALTLRHILETKGN